MSQSTSVVELLKHDLEQRLGIQIRTVDRMGGGCIAHASRVDTADGPIFVKWGTGDVSASFAAEAVGLRALREAESPLAIPEVLAVEAETSERPGFLALAWVERGASSGAFWETFGQGLAALHRHTGAAYGFASDNFIGRLPQANVWHDRWTVFFRSERLEPQMRRAREAGYWNTAWNARMDVLLDRLETWLPQQPPASIVHGDLWSGNVMPTATGTAALIDPAVYYGHREADLAMTELFGGFDARFYAAYRAAWPLEPGYDDRRDLYNLYHLINHLNHFGAGYAGSVAAILRRFG